MLKQYGYVRVGACVNELRITDVFYNVEEIKKNICLAIEKGIEILCFPELSLTGYTCQDLFLNEDLITHTMQALADLKEFSRNKDIVFIVGAPIKIGSSLYNCAISISNGKVLGITPKTFIPNYSEFYEYRYFSSAEQLTVNEILFLDERVAVSNRLLYKVSTYDICYAVELCEDLWVNTPPSNYACLKGANLIFNLSCSNEIVGKYEYRKNLVQVQATSNLCGYVYASAGLSESTTDLLFSGHLMIAEPSGPIIENQRFQFESNLIYQDIDISRINQDRIKNRCYEQKKLEMECQTVYFDLPLKNNELCRTYSQTPFLTDDLSTLEEILNIQTYALAKRVQYLGNTKMVIGISGGADSTLAFLIALRVIKVLKMDSKSLIAVTMPGFGTSNRTYQNAIRLIQSTGATLKEISIKEACLQHYKDIGHDPNVYDVTYENSQARERTQILFDLANQVSGIVIGTGDLSEIALGWATYNGDHMSNYCVNASIPKTLVTRLIRKIKDDAEEGIFKDTLVDILDTPISPELLPLDSNGNIAQKSETSVGPYILHDFFLYHFMRYGASVKKLYFLALRTFSLDKAEIKKYLTIFIKRFFTQAFKRSCMPDGVKVGSISLSPRGDFRMSSDVSYQMYLKELEDL